MRPDSTLRRLHQTYWTESSTLFFAALMLVAGACGAYREGALAVFWIGAGWALYQLEEYATHVAVFHAPVPRHRLLYRWLYRLHLGHHDRPRRVDLLFTPVWYTLPMFLLNGLVFWACSGSLGKTAALLSGLTAGYLIFEWCHLVVHSPHRPGRILSFVRRQHNGHHYWNEKRWFSLSPPALVLDTLFRTGGALKTQPRSADPERSGVPEDDPRILHARGYYRPRSDWTEHESLIWQQATPESANLRGDHARSA